MDTAYAEPLEKFKKTESNNKSTSMYNTQLDQNINAASLMNANQTTHHHQMVSNSSIIIKPLKPLDKPTEKLTENPVDFTQMIKIEKFQFINKIQSNENIAPKMSSIKTNVDQTVDLVSSNLSRTLEKDKNENKTSKNAMNIFSHMASMNESLSDLQRCFPQTASKPSDMKSSVLETSALPGIYHENSRQMDFEFFNQVILKHLYKKKELL